MAKPRFLQGFLSKEGVFWRGVLPSYIYSAMDRTVILSNVQAEQPSPAHKAAGQWSGSSRGLGKETFIVI